MPFSVFVMLLIIAVALLTVLAVMYFGAQENIVAEDHAGETSAAAQVWAARAERNQGMVAAAAVEAPVADQAPEPTTADAAPEPAAPAASSAADTGKSIGELSDAEKEAKRQAALERRKARAAKKAAEDNA